MTQQRDIHDKACIRSAVTPGFLDVPERTSKPRARGLSHVLDNGLSWAEARQRLSSAAASIDVWKFGWGTAYIDPMLEDKLALIDEYAVRACTGGTLLEIAWLQDRVDEYLDWAESAGFECVEVSCGSVPMPRDVKDELIRTAGERFIVLSEVGAKDPAAAVSPAEWSSDSQADVKAGASWVVTEGRDSGTVGIFEHDGSVRATVVDALVGAIGLERVLFEAPLKSQQAWLIRRFGANVNLGNIAISDALAVEALRLGLRSDTIALRGTT